MHDKTYFKELSISNAANGYRDIVARIDPTSYRRIPWEKESGKGATKNGVPFFLVDFLDPETMLPIAPCPRGFLKKSMKHVEKLGWKAMAGGEAVS